MNKKREIIVELYGDRTGRTDNENIQDAIDGLAGIKNDGIKRTVRITPVSKTTTTPEFRAVMKRK